MSCFYCGGEGEIVTCFDDLCRGAGECMHGDGMIPCPMCSRVEDDDDDPGPEYDDEVTAPLSGEQRDAR